MEVDKGKALANAFICMEDVFRGHKEKADRENDDVVTLCNAAGRAKEIEKDRQAEVIVDSAVAAAAKLQEEARKVISHPFEDFFRNELKKLHLEKLKFIESLVYEERAVQQRANELITAISTSLCKHFAAKEVVYEILYLKEKGQCKELPPVHPTVKRFAEIVSNPEKDEVTKNILVLINDMVTNNGITTKKQWSDSSKSLFALILDYGGPALSNQIRERIGGPSLSTLYKIVRLPYLIPQRLEPSSFARARDVF